MQKNERLTSNPWDHIFKEAIPEDLSHPYRGFSEITDFFLNTVSKQDVRPRLLDVAMGAGRHLLPSLELGFDVHGFDLAPQALKIAGEALKRKNFPRRIVLADMFETYPYPKSSFDAVMAIQAIYHGYKEDMVFSIREISRVIKPGGAFAFTVSLDRYRSAMGYQGTDCPKIREVSDKTYLPLEGREKGLVHYYPGKDDLISMLNGNFLVEQISINDSEGYILVLAIKK